MLTQKRLKELLNYDPETGVFSWIKPPRRGVAAGETGCISVDGYIQIGIDGITYYGHRLAWLYMTGDFPCFQIDHRNGIRHFNVWDNLREVSNQVNSQNKQKAFINSKTGLLGAFPKRSKFYSQITVDGIRINLGTFKTAEEAHYAYLTAKRKFHKGCTI